ncbi:hypothetical protein KOW79_013317 [Hemibagrus wyckioides]|uniref:Uncharacterized protein n=1 Tax=Hemibagrus wyckioides TaxID=337641 RepID=A0A9D3SH28_9TELE|nr:hypothetical protein KOW79_013317 [Hemibagrus wyckioides]
MRVEPENGAHGCKKESARRCHMYLGHGCGCGQGVLAPSSHILRRCQLAHLLDHLSISETVDASTQTMPEPAPSHGSPGPTNGFTEVIDLTGSPAPPLSYQSSGYTPTSPTSLTSPARLSGPRCGCPPCAPHMADN